MKHFINKTIALFSLMSLIGGMTACGSADASSDHSTQESSVVAESSEASGSEATESSAVAISEATESSAASSSEATEASTASEETAQSSEAATGESCVTLRLTRMQKEMKNGSVIEGYFATDDTLSIGDVPFAEWIFNIPEGTEVTREDVESILDLSGYCRGEAANYTSMEEGVGPDTFRVGMDMETISDEYLEEDYMWDALLEAFTTMTFTEMSIYANNADYISSEDPIRSRIMEWACWNLVEAWQATQVVITEATTSAQ